MKILQIVLLLTFIGINSSLAQRRQQNAAEVQPDTNSGPTRSRGRARFVKTPEFEKVSSDYVAASRAAASEGRSEGKTSSRLHGAGTRSNSLSTSSTRHQYEVEEHVDDIPDRSHVYHRPRVITEDKFEIPNAPRSKLFEPVTPVAKAQPQDVPVDELIKNFGSLHSDEPTKLELPQLLPQEDDASGAALSSSTTTNKVDVEGGVLSSTTEKEMERELLKKDQSTKKPESTTASEATSTTGSSGRRTVVRTRTNPRQSGSSETSSTNATPVRGRGRTKATHASRVEPTATASEESSSRGNFRVGRRRPGHTLRDRGPTITEEDSQLPKTRTGRDSNPNPQTRRGSIRNTTPRSENVEATTRNRADIRRSRGRRVETPATSERSHNIDQNPSRPTEFVSRTRSRTRPSANPSANPSASPSQTPEIRASPRIDTISSRSFQEPVRSRNSPSVETPSVASLPARDPRSRTRSRFQLSDLESVKLEPQPSVEHITRAVPRSRSARTRPPASFTEELIASSTVENPIRVTLPPTSTIRSVNAIPMRIKETVQSEVSEVISSRKVMRRKKPTPKPTKKSQVVSEEIEELNYPPQFKAIILANNAKEEKKPETVPITVSSSSSSLSSITTSSSLSSTTGLPSTTIITSTTSAPTTSSSLLTTTPLFQAKHVEDVDNDLAPTTRPTRRRFSVSTRKPGAESSPQTRKPKTLPTRKIIANPDPEKIAKFHARFNNQYQRNFTRDEPSPSGHPSSSTTTTSTKRTTKAPSRIPYSRKPDKLIERKVPQIPAKVNRYSSRYRSETRSSAPTRAVTTSPVYVPTVPTITPGPATPTHQAPHSKDAILDEHDDINIISIAQPNVNSLYSDNLVTENAITVNSSADTSNPSPVSIIERIINSISSISTTTTKPDAPTSTTESAILKIPPSPKKTAAAEESRKSKELTTEKPTTIIERILNSLSAIQASDNNVGTNGGSPEKSNLVVASVPSSTSKPRVVTVTPSASSTSSSTTSAPTTTTTTTSSSTVRVAPAPTQIPSQSTVAISLADYLASLGLGNTQRATTTTLPTTTLLDLNKNTIDYLESSTRYDLLTTTEPSSTLAPSTMEPTTSNPSTTTLGMSTTTDVPLSTVSLLGRFGGAESTTPGGITAGGTESTKSFESTTNVPTSTMRMTEGTTMSEVGTSTVKMGSTTPIINVSPYAVTITSPNDVSNNVETPATTNSNNRTGKLTVVGDANNAIITSANNNVTNSSLPVTTAAAMSRTPTTTTMSPEDYFVFAVLPNNTIVRKRPRKLSAPYFVLGVYPNNTIVRKFPNGTLVPDEPVVQVSGFDTRDPLPPSPMITSKRVTEPEATDDARELSKSDQILVDINNETEILTGKTIKEFNDLLNQTITPATTSTEITPSTTTASVTSTTELEIVQEVSTEMNIDVTTLNVPMIIELGTTTEEPQSDSVSTTTDTVRSEEIRNEVTTGQSDLETTTEGVTNPNLVETTTGGVVINARIQTDDSSTSTEETVFEDTTLPMPDTSTIVMTSTVTMPPVETETTEISTEATTIITPTSNLKESLVNPTSRYRVRLIRRRRPLKKEFLEIIRTTTISPPSAIDDLENEIRNSGTTSRVVEITTSTVPPQVRQKTTTNRPTVRYTETPITVTKPSTESNWYSTTQLPTTMFATRRVTTTPVPTTTTTEATTTRATTTMRPTTTTRATTTTKPPPTTTFRTQTTTDLTSFISNLLSTLRPVYTPTTTLNLPTTTETTTAPTITITARRRTTTTTQPTTTTTRTTTTTTTTTTTPRPTQRRKTPSPNTQRASLQTQATTSIPIRSNYESNTNPTSTSLDPRKVDIDQLVKKSKKALTPQQQRDLETLKALEKEQAALLQQLSLLTNLNLGGQSQRTSGSNLANRIVEFAKERDRQTTTEPIIYTEIPTTRMPKRLPVLDSKGTTVEDIIKELNDIQQATGPNNSIKSQEAIIAEILKQRGIQPSTPKALSEAYRPTTKRPRTTTTPRPGPLMQGLSWLFNQFQGPQPAPPPPAPRPRPTKPRTTTKRTTTTTESDDGELHFQSTEVNNVIQNTPVPKMKRPASSLSDADLSRLITQLEAIQRDPKQAQNLDLTPFKQLQKPQSTLDNKNVEIFTTGGGGTSVTRGPKAVDNTRIRTVKSTTSNSLEELDEDYEVTTARVRTTRPTRGRVTLPPVELNHVPGIEDNSQSPQVGGNFLNAAVNVTRAISTFLGAAIQGAAHSFQSIITSGSSATGGLFRASG